MRSECARILVLLGLCGALLVLVLIRGLTSIIEGRHGEAWPYALLLAAMTGYEWIWLRVVRRSIADGRQVSRLTWVVNVFLESLLPTIAIYLEIYTSLIGPSRALSSPVVLIYLLFILLSTLQLQPALSRLAGAFSAAGYAIVSIYTFVTFPEIAAGQQVLTYSTSFSYVGLLVLAGIAAGGVASQIRSHVVAALNEAENKAKIAQLQHDLDIARSIQQGLLPKTAPRIEGFDIAGWNRPADETGGDYYDWEELPDGQVALTVADVTGHGIGPALCMAACRAYARAGFSTEKDLRCLLGRLNRLLCEDLPPEKFVTLAAGRLNPSDASLQLISAGHGPLLFYSSAEDCFHDYDAQGPPLGLLSQFPYGGPQTLKFEPGDILVLVTDGFIEWANAKDEDFGPDRVKELIRAQRDQRAEKIISEMYASVLRFAGKMPQLDDLTMVVVKRTPSRA